MAIVLKLEDRTLVCPICGKQFMWTVDEQRECQLGKSTAPRLCALCEFAALYPDIHETYMTKGAAVLPLLIRQKLSKRPMLVKRTTIVATAGGPTVEMLIAETGQVVDQAFSQQMVRRRNLIEWLNGVDAASVKYERRDEMLANAHMQVTEKSKLLAELSTLVGIARELRRQELEGHLEQLELQQAIVERKVHIEKALEQLQLAQSPKSVARLTTGAVPEEDRTVAAHRRGLRTKAAAKRGALTDLLAAVREVFESGDPEEKRATEIRELLATYRQPESVLPRRVRLFLEFVDAEDR